MKNIFLSRDKNALHKFILKARGKSPESEVLHDLNGAKVTGSMERAKLFNSCCAKAFSLNLHASIKPQTDMIDSAIELNFDPATARNRLAALSASTVTDLDGFCNNVARCY